MIKLYRKFIVALLAVPVFVICMSTHALSIPEPYVYDGNILQVSMDDLNAIIDDEFGELYPDIGEGSGWVEHQMLDDGITSHTFDVSGLNWLAIKEGNKSYLYYVGDLDVFEWNSISGRSLSMWATIPDASIMWLLGSSLLGLALLGRRKSKN